MSVTAPAQLSRMAIRLIVAAAVACAFGALTEWSVLHLSDGLKPLSNSAAPWVLLAFGLSLGGCRKSESLLIGIVALVAMTLGFYVAQDLRGWAVSRQQVEFWCASSLVFGPLVGLAAGGLRHSGALAGGLGAGAVGGLLIGEGIRGLTTLNWFTPHLYWDVQIVLGAGLALGLTLWAARHRLWTLLPALALSLAACAAVSALTIAAYQTNL